MPEALPVGDRGLNRNILSRYQSCREYDAALAEDGDQGFAAAHAEMPDPTLANLSLKGTDGWQALFHLKSDPETREIPVIALTAHAMVSDRQRAFEAGFDDYDCKPVELSRLLDKMKLLLPAHAA